MILTKHGHCSSHAPWATVLLLSCALLLVGPTPPSAHLPGAGYYRPAVKREQELDVKMQWLGDDLRFRADDMEERLDKNRVNRAGESLHGGPC